MPDPAGAPGHVAGAPTPRLLVVDADERTRESIVGILGIRRRYDVVGSAGQPGAALTLAERHHPDVVIVDPRLPDAHDGMALIRRLRTTNPEARILAVGWSTEMEQDVLAAGATCFLRKTFKPGELSGAIARCLAPVMDDVAAHGGPVGAPPESPASSPSDEEQHAGQER
jgi:DNA-binding NarL/FixJ family response regulator